MPPIKLELIPNKLLLDPRFGGYKTKSGLKANKINFPHSVDSIELGDALDDLHMNEKLFCKYNHLIGDYFAEINAVYFFDGQWKLCKLYNIPTSEYMTGPKVVWTVPKTRERKPGDYNLSLKFISSSIALIGDGMGLMYIIDTGNRDNNDPFSVCFSEEVAGPNETFSIMDAVIRTNRNGIEEIHALLVSACVNLLMTTIHWVTFYKIDGTWRQEAIKQVQTRGVIHYAHLSTDCETIVVISNRECYFVLNSSFPIPTKSVQQKEIIYRWTQKECAKKKCRFISENKKIEVGSAKTLWDTEEGFVKFRSKKRKVNQMWPELMKGAQNKKNVAYPGSYRGPDEKRANVCCCKECVLSKTKPETPEDEMWLYRLNGTTNEVTHTAKLNCYPIINTSRSTKNVPPAFGYFHDEDLCFWRPMDTDEGFVITHEATLLRLCDIMDEKCYTFVECSTDLSHIAVYLTPPLYIFENGTISTPSEVADRPTRESENSMAIRHNPSLSDEGAFGIYCADRKVFLLYEDYIFMVILPN